MPRAIRRAVVVAAVAGAASMLCGLAAAPAHADVLLTHEQAAAQLRAAAVTWSSSGGCSDRDNPRCTSFDQIRATTIAGVRTLKRASRCPVNVTGGTETGHVAGTFSHWNGYKVDMSHDPCLDHYIVTSFTPLGYVPSWGYRYRAASGNVYTDEGTHWDVVYYSCGCRTPAAASG